MKGKIFGIEYDCPSLDEKFKTDWEIITDNGEDFFAQTKEVFDSEDENLSFKYRLCIECVLVEGREKHTNLWNYSLTLVPIAESLHTDRLYGAAICIGIDGNEEAFIERLTCQDISEYGLNVLLGSDNGKEFPDDNPENVDMTKVYHIANVASTINSLRGFYLDKQWNVVGNTGWDILEDAIKGIDMFKKVLS